MKTTTKKVSKRKVAARKFAKKKVVKKPAPKKRIAKRAAPKKPRAKRPPNPAFMKPMTPSFALARVVGGSPAPRTEIAKKLWEYIKRNRLQDTVNRRMINADANLVVVFGGRRQVSMFEMTKLVNQHLKGKVTKKKVARGSGPRSYGSGGGH